MALSPTIASAKGGHHGGHHGHHGHHGFKFHGPYYSSYYGPSCWWKKVKVYNPGPGPDWYWTKKKVCSY